MSRGKDGVFIPKNSHLIVKHRGVRAEIVRMESDQASRLLQTIAKARQDHRVSSDRDLVDLIIASVESELMQGGI